jgi:hypothetical protein
MKDEELRHVLLITVKDFFILIMDMKECSIIFLKIATKRQHDSGEVNMHEEEVLKEIRKLVDMFLNIAREGFPWKLPLNKKIAHEIELILRVTLLNQGAHRMNPMDNEKLRS